LANRSDRFGKPVRPVWQTGQTDFVQKLPKDQKNKDFFAQKPFSTTHRAKPVRQVWETGQAGFFLDSREEHSLQEKLYPSTILS
jgi:hypothetical protein